MKLKFVSYLLLAAILVTGCYAPPQTDYAPPPMMPAPAAEPMLPAPVPEPDISYSHDGNALPGESYLAIEENKEQATAAESMLTFSLKVDTAAYSNVERYIQSGQLPPADAVRTEELINYFDYDIGMDFGDDPFSIYTEIGPSPFDGGKHLAFIRVKSRDIDEENLPDSNLTFLIDTSGSMNSYDKLPLLQDAFSMLVGTLDENDRVSIVTYAGSSSVVLDSESGANSDRILGAIYNLSAGGSTAGADGIQTAYALAEKNYIEGGNNRVILATDGDFNVGISDINQLERLIAQKRGIGVYLSVLGFGTGNIRDDIMETLSANGNGNYSYINSRATANKVLVEEIGTMFTIADDVKAQIEFNPDNVQSYRLIGYENRQLENRDFADDTKDSGEIGVNTDVVVLFELILSQNTSYKYRTDVAPENENDFADELFEVRIRYKHPGEDSSNLMTAPVTFGDITENNSSDFRFASAVAAFGHLLRESEYAENTSLSEIITRTENSLGRDGNQYRSAFLNLLYEYEQLIR